MVGYVMIVSMYERKEKMSQHFSHLNRNYQKQYPVLHLSWGEPTGLLLTLRVSMGCLTIVESRAESPLLRLRPSAFHTSNRHATSLTEKNKTKKRK
jgi:hypothetical protein